MRCRIKHKWNYYPVKTNLGEGNVVRICERCTMLQCWLPISNHWSTTFDPNDTIAREILKQVPHTAPYRAVDISE